MVCLFGELRTVSVWGLNHLRRKSSWVILDASNLRGEMTGGPIHLFNSSSFAFPVCESVGAIGGSVAEWRHLESLFVGEGVLMANVIGDG